MITSWENEMHVGSFLCRLIRGGNVRNATARVDFLFDISSAHVLILPGVSVGQFPNEYAFIFLELNVVFL